MSSNITTPPPTSLGAGVISYALGHTRFFIVLGINRLIQKNRKNKVFLTYEWVMGS